MRRPRPAFSLIELLVVIAIIAVLIGLLLPAVQKVREAAARTTCTNNVKQLALGIAQFENAYGYYPPGDSRTNVPKASFVPFVLPYLEQNGIYQLYDMNSSWDTSANREAVTNGFKTVICPSAPRFALPAQSNGRSRQPGDYVAMNTVNRNNPNINNTFNFSTANIAGVHKIENRDGILVRRTNPTDKRIKVVEITDGTTNTLTVVESAGREKLYRKMVIDETWPNNYPEWPNNQSAATFDGHDQTGSDASRGLGPCAINCCNDGEPYAWHTGGAVFGFADGSVRFLADSTPIAHVAAMITRAGDEIVPTY